MSVFVGAGIVVGAALARDRMHQRAAELLIRQADSDPFATDHVIIEAWALINRRTGWAEALRFWRGLRPTPLVIEIVTTADLERAQASRNLEGSGVRHRRLRELSGNGANGMPASDELRQGLRRLPLRARPHPRVRDRCLSTTSGVLTECSTRSATPSELCGSPSYKPS